MGFPISYTTTSPATYVFLVISYHHLIFVKRNRSDPKDRVTGIKKTLFMVLKIFSSIKKIKFQQFSTLLSAKITLTKCVWRAIKKTKHEILFCIINFGMINLITHEHDEIIHRGYRLIKKSYTNLINFNKMNLDTFSIRLGRSKGNFTSVILWNMKLSYLFTKKISFMILY